MRIDNPQKIKQAEIVVGIPSYNEEETIGFVVEQIGAGLKKYFPNKKSVIINLDNNSSDNTKKVFFQARTNIPRIYISTPNGLRGKGYNFHNLFLMVKKLEAKAGIVFDADLRSIRGDWVKKMADPILDGHDFITPYYIRCKTDATITNHLIYPLTYGLLGWDIRQPIGGDFSFSNKMVKVWLKEEWVETTYQFGIDIFMTMTAILKKMKIAQVNLGSKEHNLSTPKLGPMFFQVIGTFFEIISKNIHQFENVVEARKIPVLGGRKLRILANSHPEEELFKKIFLDNIGLYWPVIKKTVGPSVRKKLEIIYKNKEGEIHSDIWFKIVYDFLLAYQTSKNKPALIHTLSCLYYGRIASFFHDNGKLTPEDSEKEVVKRAKLFFKKREYFFEKLNQNVD